jgi:hypothetical protein
MIAGNAKNVSLSWKSKYMPMLIKHFYNDDDEMVRSHCCSGIESTIISSMVKNEKITEWLASTGKMSAPKLLYRASRDGWGPSDFHGICDDKGATVTVVKSSDGYIFGAYSVEWRQSSGVYKSSAKAFLFSLKDHAGAVGPVKMPILSNNTEKAVIHDSSYGPMFGNGYDLRVASNANENTSSSCNVGHTYQLPSKFTKPHFLTAGSKYFTVSELEVFLV